MARLYVALALLVLVPSVSGCFRGSRSKARHKKKQAAVRHQHDESVAASQEWARARLVTPDCRNNPHRVKCGLVTDEVMTSAFVDEFVAKVCRPGAGLSPDECETKFAKMYAARLFEQYGLANVKRVRLHCDAYPLKCATDRDFELLLLEDHNNTVLANQKVMLERARATHDAQAMALADQRAAELDREDAQRREAWQNFGRTLQHVGDEMSGKPTMRCTELGGQQTCTFSNAGE